MQSTNHEHFLDENQTPVLPYSQNHNNSDNKQESSIVFSSQRTRMDYVTLEGIENRTGIGIENAYGFILKELLDNAVDFLEIQSAKHQLKEAVSAAEVKVPITKQDKVLRIVVRNSNDYGKPIFSKDMLQSVFNFDTFYSSKRNQYKISRGALGDAFKEILCIPYALAQKYNNYTEWKQPLIITTVMDNTQETFLVTLKFDRINQTIRTVIEKLKGKEKAASNFTEIEVRLPIIEDTLDLDKLSSFLIDYATINTHIGFTFSLPASSSKSNLQQQNTLSFPKTQLDSIRWTNTSSIYYYSISEFQNFIFGLDNNDLIVYNILQKTFREGSNMKKTPLTTMTVGQLKHSSEHIKELYTQLRNTMSSISSPSNLALPFNANKKERMEALKKRLEQRSPFFKVSNMKYKSKYGCYKLNGLEFPFFFEIAVVYSNYIRYNLEFTESLNSSLMPINYYFIIGCDSETIFLETKSDRKNGTHHKSRSIFDIIEYYGYSYNKDKCKKPRTIIIANLISPRIDYKSYGKSDIDLSPFAEVIAETAVKACHGGFGGSTPGTSSNEESISIIGFLRRLLKERFEAVKQDHSLKEKQKWTQSTVFYHLRPILLDYGYSPESIDRQYITSEIKNVCEQYLGVKREDLGITAAHRAQLYFKGQWYDVGLEEMNDLVQYGTDMVIIEKEGIVKQMAPFADEKGIALLNTRGFLTEYASILSEQASKNGCNIVVLTDFDVSGLLIAINIPGVYSVYHRPLLSDKYRKLPSGYTVGQTWGGLYKAWLGYCIATNKNEDEKTLLYASIIQKFERELDIPVREFAEVDMFGSAIDKEESRLAVIDPFTNETIQDVKEDEDDYEVIDFDSL